MRMAPSRGPARLPSWARNSIPVAPPVTASRAWASGTRRGTRLGTLDALLVEVEQPVPAVVGRLQLRVGGAVVEPPELLALVERGRVERLAAAERLDHALDAPVARALG